MRIYFNVVVRWDVRCRGQQTRFSLKQVQIESCAAFSATAFNPKELFYCCKAKSVRDNEGGTFGAGPARNEMRNEKREREEDTTKGTHSARREREVRKGRIFVIVVIFSRSLPCARSETRVPAPDRQVLR